MSSGASWRPLLGVYASSQVVICYWNLVILPNIVLSSLSDYITQNFNSKGNKCQKSSERLGHHQPAGSRETVTLLNYRLHSVWRFSFLCQMIQRGMEKKSSAQKNKTKQNKTNSMTG